MADDIVDTIAQYDLDEDFPPYANDQNKELNQIVREKVRLVAQLGLEIEEHQERLKILEEHLKSVKMELVHTQSLVDAKNKEIETEEHLKQITERQSGRLRNEIEKLEQRIADQQDRLNNIQNMIFKANERMDQFKLEMNWNQEELEQWALAARQKEEDNLTLEKFRRADEAKIKELTLQIEKLTVEVARKANELEQEVTETQAAQIELDKTAEEFKRLHQERHELYLQWQDTVENSRRRDELINETGVQYGNAKSWLERKKNELEQHLGRLQREKETNKETEGQIQAEERQLIKIRENLQKADEESKVSEGQVAILANQLSAFATELQNKRSNVANINRILEEKMQRLEAAKKKYQATKAKLSTEQLAQDRLESANKMAEREFKEGENMMTEVEKEIRFKKEILFKESQTLFKLRAEQANLIGDISGTLSASRNLQANITKLKIEKQRQQELLYAQDFQIQQMERKADSLRGVRSEEERTQLTREIATLTKQLETAKKDLNLLSTSNKQLKDECRNIDRVIEKVKAEKANLDTVIGELKLENEMARVDLENVIKQKEKTLVQHDIMKLEIQDLREKVNKEADKVYGFENRKYQLEMSMEEREREIQVHKDILISEEKAAMEERHKVKVELQQRKNKVKNLRIKYEGLVQRNQSSSGEVEAPGEHSQAYYVIKASQEREELERYGDELDGKVKKCEKEIKALLNTLDHLKVRNKNYRDKFMKGAEGADLERKQILEEQFRSASEDLFRKRRDMTQLQSNFETASRELMDIRSQKNELERELNDVNGQGTAIEGETGEVAQKLERMENSKETKLSNVRSVKGDGFDESPENLNVLAEVESQKHAYLLNALAYLCNNGVLQQEAPELVAEIQTTLEENNIAIPDRPSSAFDRPATSSSRRSGGAVDAQQ